MDLPYVVGINNNTSVWRPGEAPLSPQPRPSGWGRPAKCVGRDASHQLVTFLELAQALPEKKYRSVNWREGSRGTMRSRFAAVRVRPAHRDYLRSKPRPEEWLLIEWPEGESEPTKYWLSTLPRRTSLKKLVDTAKLRWRIERDYQELKQEVGLGHYEGRGWRGFHHHATLCIAAYAFLMVERLSFSPSGVSPGALALKAPAVPRAYRPRGSADST